MIPEAVHCQVAIFGNTPAAEEATEYLQSNGVDAQLFNEPIPIKFLLDFEFFSSANS